MVSGIKFRRFAPCVASSIAPPSKNPGYTPDQWSGVVVIGMRF